jgi:hypothetical protein
MASRAIDLEEEKWVVESYARVRFLTPFPHRRPYAPHSGSLVPFSVALRSDALRARTDPAGAELASKLRGSDQSIHF